MVPTIPGTKRRVTAAGDNPQSPTRRPIVNRSDDRAQIVRCFYDAFRKRIIAQIHVLLKGTTAPPRLLGRRFKGGVTHVEIRYSIDREFDARRFTAGPQLATSQQRREGLDIQPETGMADDN